MKKLLTLLLALVLTHFTWGAEVGDYTVSVTPARVQQRYPWNGLVDIVFPAASGVTAELCATNMTTGAELTVSTLTLDGATFTNGETELTSTYAHLVWDAATDIGDGSIISNATFYVTLVGTESELSGVTASTAGTSFTLDLQTGTRTSDGNEKIQWDSSWFGDSGDVSVLITVSDGTTTKNLLQTSFSGGLSGSGTDSWSETDSGTYTFTLTITSDSGSNTLTATFNIPLKTFAEGDITAEGYSGTYDGEGHTVSVTAPDGATVTYSLEENGEYTADSPEVTDVGVTTVYYRVEMENYETATGTVNVLIREPALITQAATVTKVRQRYPWNGLVDIEVTAVSNVVLNLSATDLDSNTALTVETLTLNDKVFTNGVSVLTSDSVHLVWDAATDVAEGSVLTNLAFTATMTGEVNYMVVDVSGGAAAAEYPVTYLYNAPEDGWTDAYKTEKIVMRRIPAGVYTMGSPTTEEGRYEAEETQHEVTLTSDFWIGVFETTQAQYTNLVGSNPSAYVGDTRPVETVSYETVLGESGPVSYLIAKTGLAFTLPTEAQWEYACRAGTTGAWNNGTTIANVSVDANLSLLGRYNHNRGDGAGDSSYVDHTVVGCYLPNAWGLYDMHGNVFEWCLDWYQEVVGSDAVTDPTGPDSGDERLLRGGCFSDAAQYCRSAYRDFNPPSESDDRLGFRLACAAADDAIVAEAGEAYPFTLDLRADPRETDGNETILWDAAWDGEEDTDTVSLHVIHGTTTTTLFEGATGSGEYVWSETAAGDYTLVMWTTLASDPQQMTYTSYANFTIPFKTFAEGDIVAEDATGTYDGEPHTVTVTAPDGATVTYSLTEDGEYTAESPEITKAGETTVYYRVEKENYETVEGSVTLVLNVVSISGSTMVTRSITPTSVKQRYPWNGLVDIELPSASNVILNLSATNAETDEELTVETLTLGGETFVNGETEVTDANAHLVWDAAADIGEGVVLSDLRFYATMTGEAKDVANYMVIDLSEGSAASDYPVSYVAEAPEGGWTDEYKSSKLVMRRVRAGTFTMGSPSDELGRNSTETQHEVTLTSDYWINVFEMTQGQYKNVMGTNPSNHSGDTRPVESVNYNTVLGESGPVSNLIARTGLAFSLPTDAQWEYACRAGTTGAWNNGTTITNVTVDANLSLLGRYNQNAGDGAGGVSYTQHTIVGSYLPNAWGLYDMHGNVHEMCLDWLQLDLGTDAVTDPTGPETGTSIVHRGGSFYDAASSARSAGRTGIGTGYLNHHVGFRLACAASPVAEADGEASDPVTVVDADAYCSFSLDLLATRESSGSETLPWSAGWFGDGDTVTLAVSNGETTETLVDGASGTGAYDWIGTASGTYTFTLTPSSDPENPLTATFDVSLKTFAEEDITEGYSYDSESFTVTVTAPDGATVTYSLTEEGPYSEEPITITEVGETTVYYRVEKEGYETVTGSVTLVGLYDVIQFETFSATLEELGVPGVTSSMKVKAYGLPKGVKVKKSGGTWIVTGTPTETLDGETRCAYVRVTADGVQTLHKLQLCVLPAEALWTDTVGVAVEREYEGAKSMSKLPSGIKCKKGVCSGTPKKAGTYQVKVKMTDGTKGTFVWTIEPEVTPECSVGIGAEDDASGAVTSVDGITELYQGVTYSWAITATEGATVRATGLPTGLKVQKVDGAYVLAGTPKKTGVYVAIFKTKLGSVTTVTTEAFTVTALPDWIVGTFDGGGADGQATIKVSSVGKLSGKWLSGGTNYTASATGFASYAADEEAYTATLTLKKGDVSLTTDVVFTADDVGGLGTGELFTVRQNVWKSTDAWKALAKQIVSAGSLVVAPGTAGESDALTLKFSTSGKVTVKGTLTSSDGTTATVSGSSVLCPIAAPAEDGSFSATVTVYFAPSKKLPDGYLATFTLSWDGSAWAGYEVE